MVRCVREEREGLIGSVKAVIGEQEWCRRLEEEDGGVLTVLGLYQGEREREEIIGMPNEFLVKPGQKRVL